MVVVRKKSKSASASSSSTRKSTSSTRKSTPSTRKSTSSTRKSAIKPSATKPKVVKATKKVSVKKPSKKSSQKVRKETPKKVKAQVKKSQPKRQVSKMNKGKSKNSTATISKGKNAKNKNTKNKDTKNKSVKKNSTKKQVFRKPQDLDVSDLELGTSMHPRLDKLQSESGVIGGKLEKMDEKLGLPPLPASGDKPSDIVKTINNFEDKLHKDDLKKSTKKKSFFAKLLGDDSNDNNKSKKHDSLNHDSLDSKAASDDLKTDDNFNDSESLIDLNYKPDFSMENIDLSSLTPAERKEFSREEKELEELEKKINDDESKNSFESTDNNPKADTAEKILPRPNTVQEEFRIEEPMKKEATLKFESPENSETDKKAKKNKKSKKNKKDKKNKKGESKKENNVTSKTDKLSETDENVQQDSQKEILLLPPGEKEAKPKKKGFLAKLFGSSKSKKEDSNVSNKSSVANLDDEVKITTPTSDTSINLNEQNPFEQKPVGNGQDKDGLESNPKSEPKSNDLANENSDEHSTSFLSDSIESELGSRSGYDEDVADDIANKKENDELENADNPFLSEDAQKETENANLKKDKTDEKKNDSNVPVSTLEARKEKIRKEIKELEKELSERKAEYEDKTTALNKKEQLLDKRERDLDDRENILLTLQTDLIRERKELDKREFEFFMNKGNNSPPERPTITLSIEKDLKSLPSGMSDERMKLEQLLNQTRTLAINRDFAKAKSSYNRLVEKFHSVELTPSDKESLHLSIKELFNDINILMKSEQATYSNVQETSEEPNPNNNSAFNLGPKSNPQFNDSQVGAVAAEAADDGLKETEKDAFGSPDDSKNNPFMSEENGSNLQQ